MGGVASAELRGRYAAKKKWYVRICRVESTIPGLKTALGKLCVEWHQRAIITKEGDHTEIEMFLDNIERLERFIEQVEYFCEAQSIPEPSIVIGDSRRLPKDLCGRYIVLVEKSDVPRIISSGHVAKDFKDVEQKAWNDDRVLSTISDTSTMGMDGSAGQKHFFRMRVSTNQSCAQEYRVKSPARTPDWSFFWRFLGDKDVIREAPLKNHPNLKHLIRQVADTVGEPCYKYAIKSILSPDGKEIRDITHLKALLTQNRMDNGDNAKNLTFDIVLVADKPESIKCLWLSPGSHACA